MPLKPVRIAQISDLHIRPPGSLAYGRVDTARALERCVAALNGFDPAPDFVVISGDLADTPASGEYDHLKRLLAPLKLPFAGIPGNHDSRELMRAAFPQGNYASASGALDQRNRNRRARSGAARFERARQTLWRARSADLAMAGGDACVFPPGGRHGCSCTIRHSGPASGTWTGRTCSMPAISPWWSAAIRACGSSPPATSTAPPFTMFAGVPTTICPAPNHAVDLDLEQLREPSFKVEPASFHLHTWFPGDGSATSSPIKCRSETSTSAPVFSGRMGSCCKRGCPSVGGEEFAQLFA